MLYSLHYTNDNRNAIVNGKCVLRCHKPPHAVDVEGVSGILWAELLPMDVHQQQQQLTPKADCWRPCSSPPSMSRALAATLTAAATPLLPAAPPGSGVVPLLLLPLMPAAGVLLLLALALRLPPVLLL
jgi:hypothetical protein